MSDIIVKTTGLCADFKIKDRMVRAVNRVSLSRSFSRLYGTSISGYLSGRRIQAALEYLKNTELSIAEIAGMCGFSSASYFSRVISEATGRPPGKIRF